MLSSNSNAPLKLGVNPSELFTTSMFSKMLNMDIRNSDFITITISDSNYSSRVATIVGIIKDDNLTVSFGSNFDRPFESVLNKAQQKIAGNIGGAISGAAKATGTPLYNRYTSVPIWQSPKMPTYSFTFILFATSNPATQVEQPILLLSRIALPKSRAQESGAVASNLSVITPGPKLNGNIGEIASTTQSAFSGGSVDASNLISNAGAISIQYGGLAFFSNCVISNTTSSVKNIRTLASISATDSSLLSSESNSLPYYTYAEVTIEVMPFFPPEYSSDVGNNLGDIYMFYESSSVDKYSTFI